jgi:hypothetical protein
MSGLELKLDNRFLKKIKGTVEAYDFQIGVLQDKPHQLAQDKSKGLTSYASGPTRKKSRAQSGLTVSQVSEKLRKHTGINFYTKPFKSTKNKDIVKFIEEFFKVISGRSQPRRLENLLQAVVRNPILRGDYGRNSTVTRGIKGFDRLMIDTGQLFKSIIAKAVKRV